MPLLDKLLDRVKNRPAAQPDNGMTIADPGDKEVGSGVDQAPSASLMQRVRDKVLSLFKPEERAELDAKKRDALPAQRGDIAKMQWMIRRAAATSTLLLMQYNSTWRLVEPYEMKSGVGSKEGRFFCFCLLHAKTHGLYLSRAGGMQNTDQPFKPRWPIKIT